MATTMGGHRKTTLGPSEDRCKRGTTPGMPPRAHFGLTGLATMGANLARNVAHHDIPSAVHTPDRPRTTAFLEQHADEARSAAMSRRRSGSPPSNARAWS